MKRSLSSVHGGSTALALAVGAAAGIVAAQIWPALTLVENVGIQTGVGALMRWVEYVLGPGVQRRKVQVDIEKARKEREVEQAMR